MRLLLRILLVNQILAIALLIAFALMYGPRNLPHFWLPILVFTQAVGGCVGLLFAGLNAWGIYHGAPKVVQHISRIGAVVLGTILGITVGFLLIKFLRPELTFNRRMIVNTGSFALLIAAVMATINILLEQLKARIEQKAIEIQKLRELEAQTRLTSLQGKVNPHFLFNTLNTMLNLVHTSPDAVEDLILRLSELYRSVLKLPDTGFITLAEELELVRRYLEIEQIRLGDRLTFAVEMDPAAAAIRIPPLFVEPLAENAVKHGIGPKPEGGRIHIQARIDGHFLVVVVEDDGAGAHAGISGNGFGLYSIRERLRMLYGGRGDLVLIPGTKAGFRAELRVPCD
ncbi:MAG: histidine kinase [Holophaga sp.]|nr:histidine kinase [Holophaga sp.]